MLFRCFFYEHMCRAMPLPWLAFIAALLPHSLALRDGFSDMSYLSANLSHVRGAVAEPDVHPVPTPLEACGTYGHGLPCPPRTSPSTSSKSLHVLDSDKHPPFSRGTIALAWAGELLHTAGPPRLLLAPMAIVSPSPPIGMPSQMMRMPSLLIGICKWRITPPCVRRHPTCCTSTTPPSTSLLLSTRT